MMRSSVHWQSGWTLEPSHYLRSGTPPCHERQKPVAYFPAYANEFRYVDSFIQIAAGLRCPVFLKTRKGSDNKSIPEPALSAAGSRFRVASLAPPMRIIQQPI